MPINLMTMQGEALLQSNHTPWEVYPRPQMKRDSFLNLNGIWDFSVGNTEFDQAILVPFCPESQLSGLQLHPEDGKDFWYRRNFTLP